MRTCETFRCIEELNVYDSFFPFWSGGNTTGKEKGDLVKSRTRLMTNKLTVFAGRRVLINGMFSSGCTWLCRIANSKELYAFMKCSSLENVPLNISEGNCNYAAI